MSSKAVWAMRIYRYYIAGGMSRPDAAVKAVNLVSNNWAEYVSVYNEIKEVL